MIRKSATYILLTLSLLAIVNCGGGGGNNSNSAPSNMDQAPTPKLPPEWQAPSKLIEYSGNGSSGFQKAALKRNRLFQVMLIWLDEGFNFDASLVGMLFDMNGAGWSAIRTFSGNSDDVYSFTLDLNNAGDVSMAWLDRPTTSSAVLNDQAWGFASLGRTLMPAARLDINNDDEVSIQGPTTVIDDNGNITTVWIQKGRVRVSQYTVVSGLKEPETLDTGLASPILTYMDNDDAGNVMVVWREYGDTTHNIVTNYYQVGVGWLGAETLWRSESPPNPYSIAVSMNDQGKALVAWASDENFPRLDILANIYTPGSGWEGEQVIQYDEPITTTVKAKLADNDTAFIVWRGRVGLLGAGYTPSQGWSAPERLDNAIDQGISGFTLDIKDDGSRLIAWSQGVFDYLGGAEIYTRFYDPDNGWEPIERITDGEESVTLIDSIYMYDSEALVMWKVRESNSAGSLWTAEYK